MTFHEWYGVGASENKQLRLSRGPSEGTATTVAIGKTHFLRCQAGACGRIKELDVVTDAEQEWEGYGWRKRREFRSLPCAYTLAHNCLSLPLPSFTLGSTTTNLPPKRLNAVQYFRVPVDRRLDSLAGSHCGYCFSAQ